MHRLARERLRIRTIQAREEVSSASTMCLDASVGSGLYLSVEDGHLFRCLAGDI